MLRDRWFSTSSRTFTLPPRVALFRCVGMVVYPHHISLLLWFRDPWRRAEHFDELHSTLGNLREQLRGSVLCSVAIQTCPRP